MAEFKKLSDVNVIESINDNLNVLVENGGEIVKIAANKVVPSDVVTQSEMEEAIAAIPEPVTSWNDLMDKPFYENDEEVIQIDEKFIPDSIARTADISMDYVKTVNGETPDENGNVVVKQELTEKDIYSATAGTLTLTWDNTTDGRDTFASGTWTYYKVSDFQTDINSITKARITRNNGMTATAITPGTGCCGFGYNEVILVNAVGQCTVGNKTFTTPSTGIYFVQGPNNTFYATELVLNCDIPKTSIKLNSADGKSYLISIVNGALTATEV